jgi:hemolysin activation/secretion protein
MTFRLTTWGLGLCLLGFIAGAAFAQGDQSGQVERSVNKKKDPREAPEKPEPSIRLPEEGKKLPAGGGAALLVTRFEISGSSVFPADRLHGLVAAAEGKELTLSDMKEEADRITRFYRDQGYPLAWAYLPAQEIREGIVRIEIMEPRIGRIRVEGNRHYSSELILDHLGGLRGDPTLVMRHLERALLTLNDLPRLDAQVTLRPGGEPGTTDLHVTVEEQEPISLTLDYSNLGSAPVSESRFGASLSVYDLWEAGHWIELRALAGSDSGEIEYGSLRYHFPSTSGLKITGYFSHYGYEAGGPLSPLEPAGSGNVFGLSGSYPLKQTRTLGLKVTGGLEFKNLEQELIAQPTTKDKLRVLMLGLELDHSDGSTGRWLGSLQLRQGLAGFAGGLEDDDPDASRTGAGGGFTVGIVRLYRLQRLARGIQLIAKVHGQFTSEPLVSSEQIWAGGFDSVRGYPPFEYMGDSGYNASLECRFRLPFWEGEPIYEMLQLTAFIDAGRVSLEEPGPGEPEDESLSGAGIGIRLTHPEWGSVQLDVGWPLSDPDPSTGDEPIIYVAVNVNVK